MSEETKRELYTRINHTQEDGIDTVVITAGDGWVTYTAKESIYTEMTPFESAVSSLWSGYFHATDHIRELGAYPLSIISNVAGAVDAFIKELEAGASDGGDGQS
ncbi:MULTISPECIES: hypothetical protein [Paenibacillus]|uniref:Uncharacterized protein n=1 Tax=Paenibacillus xylanivorans TaxID=1705561 RepID=A0A0M9BI15_9BACL|nr:MULTISPECIES: hypothetical protein [Paenibacillus]KOY12603.1 hypothetical protein AMS66_29780 [Paenibacillus xylanivorans]